MKICSKGGPDRAELQLTSMIDVVFLLLIFFVMTFKIAAQEGDFSVRMPLQGSGAPSENLDLPIKLRLKASADGQLQEITVNDSRSFGTDFEALRGYILQLTGGTTGPTEKKVQKSRSI